MLIPLSSGPAGLTFAVRVTPRARRTAIAGVRGPALAIQLASPPVDGAANEALVILLSKIFGRPRRDITILSGHTSRQKRVAVAGVTESEFDSRLNDILNP